MIKVTVRNKSQRVKQSLERMKAGLTPEGVDHVVDRAAFETLGALVDQTPKRFFGQVRRGWQVQKPAEGSRRVVNENKIMLFLEEGTADNGTGFIYPKRKKVLFLPLNRRAAGGWSESLIPEQDYILRPRVRGIRAMNIVAKQRPKTRARLKVLMKDFVRSLVRGGGPLHGNVF